MSEGVVTPAKKKIAQAVVSRALGKVCNWDTVEDSVKSQQKDRRKTQAVAETNYHRGQKIAKLIIFELMLAIS